MNMTLSQKMKFALALAASAAFIALTGTTLAQTEIFNENFDSDATANWQANSITGATTPADANNPANFFFDYSTVGIPSAPNSTGGTTRGIKLQANLDVPTQGIPSGVSVSPLTFGILGNFEMRFDWWINYNGPMPAGGSGSTQIGGAGFGTAGTGPQVGGNSGAIADSIFFGATGDGGATDDYRVYSPDYVAGAGLPADVFAAGDRNATGVAYYGTNFPGQTPPSAQTTLFPNQTGASQDGSMAYKWREVSLKKIANILTYTIDGVLIATTDVNTNGTLGGTNILFNHYDINSTASADTNSANISFSLFDNVRITNFPTAVFVSAPVTNASEQGPVAGVFTLTRTAIGTPLTVTYAMTGTAVSNVDYTISPSGAVTFGAADVSTNITVTPVDDATPEGTETAILTLNDSTNYIGAGSATITIADNETSQLVISNISTQVYERTNDYAQYRVSRLGNTNATAFNVNLSYAGTAISNVDYYTETVTLNPGDETKTFKIYPIADSLIESNETVICSLVAAGGGEYSLGSPTTAETVTVVDANLRDEVVLFSDNFDTDTSANWVFRYASTNGVEDYQFAFNYDYSSDGIPAAPHSSGDTHGLRATVNKSDVTPLGASGINFYPISQTFTGDYALRFDMYLIDGGGGSATEYALFGINHSGTKTNWFRSGGVPAGWNFDGLFFDIESDGQASATDYALYSSPTTGGNAPTTLTSRTTSGLTSVFKSPPWAVTGIAANLFSTTTPIWADVEVSQIGNIVTLKVNATTILTYTNTGSYTSGNIMMGYVDGFDSIGPINAAVIYDNVRVVSQVTPRITSTVIVGSNLRIDFEDSTYGPWTLVSSPTLGTTNGAYTSTSATFTTNGVGHFRATTPYSSTEFSRLYRISR